MRHATMQDARLSVGLMDSATAKAAIFATPYHDHTLYSVATLA